MGILRKIITFPVRILDLRVDRWLDLKRHVSNTTYLVGQARSIFKIDRASRSETFEQAVTRLRLSEDDLDLQRKRFLFLAGCFLLFAFMLFLYDLYLLFQRYWMGFFMTLALILYSLSQAFRFHFWYFQIKHKKLGCTLSEWFKSLS